MSLSVCLSVCLSAFVCDSSLARVIPQRYSGWVTQYKTLYKCLYFTFTPHRSTTYRCGLLLQMA